VAPHADGCGVAGHVYGRASGDGQGLT
jgi:hypothetical protein